MKKRTEVNDDLTVNGFYIKDVEIGFFGEQDEGKRVLRAMGLPDDVLPFSAAAFLQDKKIRWKDCDGRVASLSFKVKDDQIEFFGSYLGNRKSARMFREWGDYEEHDKVAHLESEAIGNLCMMCIFEKLPDAV